MSMLAPPPPTAPLPAPIPSAEQVRMWNMWCHLSALAGLIIPFGNVLGPLVIWQIKKNEIPSVDAHGKAALNFQLSVLIVVLIAAAVAVPLLFFFCLGFLVLLAVPVILLIGKIFAIIAAVQANDGREFRYPWSLPLIT